MTYVSLFSGIEAATVAWASLGWTPLAFAEVDPYCRKLLATRFPDVPNLGNVRQIDWSEYVGTAEIVVGGSPCQAFSVAGKREGLMDERGRLMLEYIRAVHDLRPRWLLWENVPGVLSQSDGDAFDTLIRELDQCGYCLAWRVLDAQFFGVAQRRRRVFVVGHRRAGCAAAVLFERESLRWDFASSRQKRKALAEGSRGGARSQYGDVAGTLCARYDSSASGTGGQNIVAFQYGVASDRSLEVGDTAPTIKTDKPPAVCFSDLSDCLTASYSTKWNGNAAAYNGSMFVKQSGSVRRLTPVECERLQGFPDGYTQLGDTKDAPRYRALGNSMAVPVVRWIGERIAAVDTLIKSTLSDSDAPRSRRNDQTATDAHGNEILD